MPISPILDALYHGRPDQAQHLLADRDTKTLTVHEAAAMGVVTRLEAVLAEDPGAANAWSDDGFQPLALAAFFGRGEALRLLLARGADVNTPARNLMQVTALHAALAGPAPEVATLLVAAGADPNARQQGRVTPLHEAAGIGNIDLVKLLLEHGADPAAVDDQGRTAADVARDRSHASVVELLAAH